MLGFISLWTILNDIIFVDSEQQRGKKKERHTDQNFYGESYLYSLVFADSTRRQRMIVLLIAHVDTSMVGKWKIIMIQYMLKVHPRVVEKKSPQDSLAVCDFCAIHV